MQGKQYQHCFVFWGGFFRTVVITLHLDLSIVTGWRLKAFLALPLMLFSLWCLRRWCWRGVRSIAKTTPILWAALMSSPEWWAGWQRWSVLSLSPHSAEGALIGRQTSKLQKTMLWTKVRKRNVFAAHLNSNLFASIIICNLGLRTTTVSMSFTQGQGYVWSESCWVFFMEDARVKYANLLLVCIHFGSYSGSLFPSAPHNCQRAWRLN